MLLQRRLLIPFVFLICCFATQGSAQEKESLENPESAQKSILISVRGIRASQGRNAMRIQSLSAVSPVGLESKRRVEKSLTDVSGQLEHLPFSNYRLLFRDTIRVGLKQKQLLRLRNGHSLMLRPLYIGGSRACLSVKWNDPAGETILDTRLHFDSTEPLLAGTENTVGDDSHPATGMILAIGVSEPQE